MKQGVTIAAGLLALVSLAGCLEFDGDGTPGEANQAPDAELLISDSAAWTGDEIIFDARDSKDPDGEIVRYEFDFGDGATQTVTDKDDARVSHTYAEGGEYVATVTVVDNGADTAGSQSDTATMNLAINQEQTVPHQFLFAAPTTTPRPATYNQSFHVNDGSDRFELMLTFENVMITGSSDVTIQVLDPDQDVLVDQRVTVQQDENRTVNLTGPPLQPGDHDLSVTAEDGGVAFYGTLLLIYSE